MLDEVALGMRGHSVTMALNWVYNFWEAQTNHSQRTQPSEPSALRAPRHNQDVRGRHHPHHRHPYAPTPDLYPA